MPAEAALRKPRGRGGEELGEIQAFACQGLSPTLAIVWGKKQRLHTIESSSPI